MIKMRIFFAVLEYVCKFCLIFALLLRYFVVFFFFVLLFVMVYLFIIYLFVPVFFFLFKERN